jgi:hypothetical protein
VVVALDRIKEMVCASESERVRECSWNFWCCYLSTIHTLALSLSRYEELIIVEMRSK